MLTQFTDISLSLIKHSEPGDSEQDGGEQTYTFDTFHRLPTNYLPTVALMFGAGKDKVHMTNANMTRSDLVRLRDLLNDTLREEK